MFFFLLGLNLITVFTFTILYMLQYVCLHVYMGFVPETNLLLFVLFVILHTNKDLCALSVANIDFSLSVTIPVIENTENTISDSIGVEGW